MSDSGKLFTWSTRADLKFLSYSTFPIVSPIPHAAPPVSTSPNRERTEDHIYVEFSLREAKSPDRMISYLTRKQDGNVHKKGIIAIPSKSVFFCSFPVCSALDRYALNFATVYLL
jgi:hypothetical protein